MFDSGLGGLTVVRALREALPHEDIVYLGDTARVPYGTKGPATVIKYALGCARHLVGRGVKAIVIACNTVSAVAPDRLRIELDLPVLGVIEPGARAAVAATRNGKIGVLATAATIASGAYPRAVSAISTRAETIGQAAPLLVPLAEEGWTEGEVPRLAVRRYLEPLGARGGGRRRPRVHALPAPARRHRGGGARAHRGGRARRRQRARRRGRRARVPDVARARARRGTTEARDSAPRHRSAEDVRETSPARFLGGDASSVEQIDL